MTTPPDEFQGELRLGRKFTTTNQTAAGGLIILIGLLILQSNQAIALAGTRAPLAGFLVSIVFALTLANVVELLGGSGERGGTYMLVEEILGGVIAFVTGWSILAGSVALVAALALFTANQFLSLFSLNLSLAPFVAFGLVLFLILAQVFQIYPQRIRLYTIVIPLIAIFVIILLSALPHIHIDRFEKAPPVSMGAINNTIAWFAAGYIAFESLLISRRQIHDPGRFLPAAIRNTVIVGGLVTTFALFIFVGLSAPATGAGSFIESELASAGIFLKWAIAVVALIALLLATNGVMMTAARQIHALSLEGAFPRLLRRIWGPIPMPVALFGLLALLITPLIFLVSINWLVNLAALLFIVVMLTLNIAAIYSQETEPERRRSFVVPFHPLFPALAIAVNLVLIFSLPSNALLASVVWLVAGTLFYLAYARHRQVEAQEGEVVFGRVQQKETKEPAYRILVPIGPGEERHLVFRMATALAHQLNSEVIPLQVITVPDPLAIEEGRRTARERNISFRWSTQMANEFGVPIHPITRLARNISEGIIDTATEENCNLIFISWFIKDGSQEGNVGSVLSQVARQAPSDVAVVAYHVGLAEPSVPDGNGKSGNQKDRGAEQRFHPNRILVPTSGGPNAPLAIRLALLLAREYDSTVTAVYAADEDASQEEIAEGEQRIQQTINAMREQAAELPSIDGQEAGFEEIPIEGRVIKAPNVVSGIADAGTEYDLVLMGASEESLIDQMLFGNIPEQVALQCPSPVIIVKRYRGLPRLWLQRAWTALYEALPTLNREEQIEVYRSIHRDARPDVDFFIMIGLSALIATFGLLQNSTAVIIGAMLVAPLFSPLLGISLAIVQGNVRLLRLAIESTVKGIALAIGLSILLAVIAPFKSLTPAITSRSLPNLFDLAVALASGSAGAYAIARKDVAAALPGVAIAAALVPPLGVIGIGLALGNLTVAGGGSLLLVTNLVAIALAGAITFLLLGFRPGGHGARDVHLRRGLMTTIILLLLVTIPLAAFFARTISTSSTDQIIHNTLVAEIQKNQSIELVNPDEINVQIQGGEMIVTVPVYASQPVTEAFVKSLSDKLSQTIDQPLTVRLVVYSIIQSSP